MSELYGDFLMILIKHISTVFTVTWLCLNQNWQNSWSNWRLFFFPTWWWKLYIDICHDMDLMAFYLSSNDCVTPVCDLHLISCKMLMMFSSSGVIFDKLDKLALNEDFTNRFFMAAIQSELECCGVRGNVDYCCNGIYDFRHAKRNFAIITNISHRRE